MILVVLLSPLLWLVRLALLLLFAVPGLALIAWQARNIETEKSRRHPDRRLLQFRAWWMALYCNEEDGIDGLRGADPAQAWWASKTNGWSAARRIFIWSALRNPVDGLRWLPVLNLDIDPTRVRFIGLDHEPKKGEGGCYFAWQGLYSCLRYETRHFRLWIGWKLKPTDRLGLQPGDVRAIRCDFAVQLKRIAGN